jgi:hypothetical protein
MIIKAIVIVVLMLLIALKPFIDKNTTSLAFLANRYLDGWTGTKTDNTPVKSGGNDVTSVGGNNTSAGETVVMFIDWDDTIFPTTYITCLEDSKKSLDPFYGIYMQKVLIFLKRIIKTCDKVFIVSNGSTGWLDDCINKNSEFKQMLNKDNVEVISSRDCYSKVNPSPIHWKHNVFLDSIKKVKQIHQNNSLNITCVGDDMCEWVGVKRAVKDEKNVCLKRVKLLEGPSLISFTTQLVLFTTIVEDIVKCKKVINACFHNKVDKQVNKSNCLGTISDIDNINFSRCSESAKIITPSLEKEENFSTRKFETKKKDLKTEILKNVK